MSEVVSLGQRLTVTFLAFCSATGLLNVLGGVPVERSRDSFLLSPKAYSLFSLPLLRGISFSGGKSAGTWGFWWC
jgi:hypothetical protein